MIWLQTSKFSAWRAVYLMKGEDRSYGRAIAYIGIDPVVSMRRAELFVGLGHRQWRVRLPECRYWWRLDGRRSLRKK